MKSPIHILLAEDNEGDILLTEEAFEENEVPAELSIVNCGKDTIDFTLNRGRFYNKKGKPDLILLDINMPKKNGFEVLEVLKTNELSKKIPIIVLTTSSMQKDIDIAYQLHANSYITKPQNIEDFVSVVQKIKNFWIQTVELSDS